MIGMNGMLRVQWKDTANSGNTFTGTVVGWVSWPVGDIKAIVLSDARHLVSPHFTSQHMRLLTPIGFRKEYPINDPGT